MLVKELLEDAANILGKNKNDPVVLKRISQAVEILANKSQGLWDGMTGTMDIVTDNRTVTLPADVRTPLAMSFHGVPTFGRDVWFEYHLNGPGSTSDYHKAWDDEGFFSCFRELESPAQVQARCATAADEGKTVTVVGYDDQDREQQEVITLNFVNPPSSTHTYKIIKRVFKDTTTKDVTLWANPGVSEYAIGRYYGYETRPNYRRIKVPSDVSAIRLRYLRNTRQVTSENDWIPLSSEMAVLEAVRSIHHRFLGQWEKADVCEKTAMRYIEEDEATRHFNTPIGPQVLYDTNDWNERLYS